MQEALTDLIHRYLRSGRKVHLVGIGGVSMRTLAVVLRQRGMEITGSDMNLSEAVKELQEMGFPVHIGHRAENVGDAECIVRSAAIHEDNPEIKAARAKGIPVFERAQAWGMLMKDYPNAICISGTHGKTTTTAMVTHIFMEAQKDPTVMIGGYLPLLKSGHRVGNGQIFIAEACEYCNSFLSFYPTVAVINNIEADHLDFFKDLDDIKASFRRFAELTPPDGRIIVNGDDANTLDTVKGMDYLTFGFGQGNDVHPVNVSEDMRSCDILCGGKFYCHLQLQVIGIANLIDAVGACAVAWHMGIDGETTARALAAFRGAKRRQEFKGHCNGADVYDDFAHHPQEIKVLLEAMRTLKPQRLILVFQPYTYTRTRDLFDDFVEVLQMPDLLVMPEVYPAREEDIYNIHSRDLAAKLPGCICVDTLEQVADCLRKIARPGDVIVTTGCGNVYLAAEAIVEK